MLSILSHQGGPRQNHREKPLLTYQGGYYQKKRNITSIDEDVEKLEPSTLMGGRSLVQPQVEPGRGFLRT